MTLYVCPKCGGQQQAITGATLWHPCPRNKGKQVRLEVSCACIYQNDMAITTHAAMNCPKHGERTRGRTQ